MTVQQSALMALTMALIWLGAYFSFQQHFSAEPVYIQQLERLSSELERERMRTLLAEMRMRDFQQEVAALVPQWLDSLTPGQESYPLRNLASVTAAPPSPSAHRNSAAEILLEEGKREFRQGQFARAIRSFEFLIEQQGYSRHAVEAYFLLVESHYQLQQHEQVLARVEQMIQLFPGHELTGTAMIRMGHVFEYRRRTHEAQAVYRSLIQLFPGRAVASQAQEALSELEF